MSLTDTARPFSTGLGEQVDEAGDWMTMPRRPAPDTLGRKHDAEKPRLDLLVEGMPRALEEVGKVLTYGSHKYADHNWQHLPEAARNVGVSLQAIGLVFMLSVPHL